MAESIFNIGELNGEVVHKTGNETIAGSKTFSSIPEIMQDRYGAIRFKNRSDKVHTFIQTDQGSTTNQTLNRVWFGEYSPKVTEDTGNTGFYERYNLPSPTAGLTANAAYDILTSKNHMVKVGTFSSSNSLEVAFDETGYYFMIGLSGASTRCYCGLVYGQHNGSPIVIDLNKGSNITVTASTGKLTFTSASQYATTLFALNFDNDSFTATNPV